MEKINIVDANWHCRLIENTGTEPFYKPTIMTSDDDFERVLADLLLVDISRPTFDASYTLKKKLMSGSYGTVFAGLHNLSSKEFAIKVVDRR